MLERGGHLPALFGIVAQPVEQLGESPLGGVDAAAPAQRFELLRTARVGDLTRFALGAMVAPEVIVVQRLEPFVHGDDARAGGVERDSPDVFSLHTGGGEGSAGRGYERVHVVAMTLSGVVRVFFPAEQRIVGGGGAESAFLMIENGNTHAEGAEIHACD